MRDSPACGHGAARLIRTMKLTSLKPRLATLNTQRLTVLDTKAGATKRIRGRAGMKERQAARVAGLFTCVDCGHISVSNEIDHEIPLEQGGANHPSNYRVRCINCHRAKSKLDGSARRSFNAQDNQAYMQELLRPRTLKPSGIPLTIVCGPAGGGKSTFIRRHKGKADLVIDMDAIRTELGIGSEQWDADTLKRSLTRRNELLAGLATSNAPRAWFIVSAATNAERKWWGQALQPERLVVVMASQELCLHRIGASRQGDRAARSTRATVKWWSEYTNEAGHEVVNTGM